LKSAEAFLAELNSQSPADLGLDTPADNDFANTSNCLAELTKRIESKAVAMLAMREHGAKELKQKLRTKFPETPALLEQYGELPGLVNQLIDDVVLVCQENNWQSDERYVEQAVRNYMAKGHGPLKIKQKLQQACADSSLISAYLDIDEADWADLAKTVLEKKYGDCHKPSEQKQQAKRMRFLQSRGFAQSTIWKAFR